MEIFTSRGMMEASLLHYSKGRDENDNEVVEWEEWRASDGEIVKRNVQVALKKGLGALMTQGAVG